MKSRRPADVSTDNLDGGESYLEELDCVVDEEVEEEVEEAVSSKQDLIQAFTIGILVGVFVFVLILVIVDCWRTGGRPTSFANCDACRKCALSVWTVMDRFHWLQERYEQGVDPYVSVRTLMGHFDRRGASRLEEEEEEGEQDSLEMRGREEGEGLGDGGNPVTDPPPNPNNPSPTPSKPIQVQEGEEDSFVNATSEEQEDPDDGVRGGARRKRSLFSYLRPGPRGYQKMPPSASSPSPAESGDSASSYKSAAEDA